MAVMPYVVSLIAPHVVSPVMPYVVSLIAPHVAPPVMPYVVSLIAPHVVSQVGYYLCGVYLVSGNLNVLHAEVAITLEVICCYDLST